MPEVLARFWAFCWFSDITAVSQSTKPCQAEKGAINTCLPIPFTIPGLLQCLGEEIKMNNYHFLKRVLLAMNSVALVLSCKLWHPRTGHWIYYPFLRRVDHCKLVPEFVMHWSCNYVAEWLWEEESSVWLLLLIFNSGASELDKYSILHFRNFFINVD